MRDKIRTVVGPVRHLVRWLWPTFQREGPSNQREGPSKPLWQQLWSSLPIPPGAVDPYHFQYDDETKLQGWCARLGFKIARRSVYRQENVFLELQYERA